MVERRSTERVSVALNAHWEGVLVQCSGTVIDLSISGCFILTPDQVQTKELIRIEIEKPTGGRLYLWGEVVYQVSEMGFALHFTGTTEREEAMLKLLIDYVRDERLELPVCA
jgi:PilZ domain